MKKNSECNSRLYTKENNEPKISNTMYSNYLKIKQAHKKSTSKSNYKKSRQPILNSISTLNRKGSMSIIRKNISLNSVSFSKDPQYYTVSQTKTNLQNNSSSQSILITSYENSIIVLFNLLKNILSNNQYQYIKNSFFAELDKNLSQKNIDNSYTNKTINCSLSCSIALLLEECKKKFFNKRINMSQYTTTHANNIPKNISHKSLYSLSKSSKKVCSNSPSKTANCKQNNLSGNFSFNNRSIPHKKPTLKYYNLKKCTNCCFSKLPNKTEYKNETSENDKIGYKINKTKNEVCEKQNNDIDMMNKNFAICDVSNNSINSELLSKVKSSLDDNLKGFFEFSYKNFLNKETERDTNRSIKKSN